MTAMKSARRLLIRVSPHRPLVRFDFRKSCSRHPAKKNRSTPLRPDPARSLRVARLTRWVRFIVLAGAIALSAQEGHARVASSTLLERGKTIEQYLAGGESHEYKFLLQAGQYAKVSIEQRTIDVGITCSGPDGRQ